MTAREDDTGRLARIEAQTETLVDALKDHITDDRRQQDAVRASIDGLRETLTASRVSLGGIVAVLSLLGSLIGGIVTAVAQHLLH